MTAAGDVSRRVRRDRILEAVVQVVAERGFAGTTVRLVTARAGVSSRTFYECFEGLEDCLAAIMDETLGRTRVLVEDAFAREDAWWEGVRGALAGMLAFFDGEPELARVCVLETLAAGPVVLEHRERAIGEFRAFVVAHLGTEASRALPLAFESTVVSVIGMVHARLVAGEGEPLIVLLGPLMGLILAPYLGEDELEEEVARANELARAILCGDVRWAPAPRAADRNAAPGMARDAAPPAIPGVLGVPGVPGAHRARECLIFLAGQNGRGLSPSNREIAEAIGMAYKSQVSELLAQMLEEGFLSKSSEGAGKRNAWRLTPRGEQVARALKR